MFVADFGSNDVTVISDATNAVVTTIPVGSNPRGVAYDRGTGEIFVANDGSDNVSVISDTTNRVVATIPVGLEPHDIAYDSGRGEVFVANFASDNVSVISDARTAVVATIPVGSYPDAVAYDAGKGELFAVNFGSQNVSVISDATDTVVASVPVGAGPQRVAYDPRRGEVFVTNAGSSNVTVISDATNTAVASIYAGSPVSVAIDATTGEVFVTNSLAENVTVISDATNAVVATIAVGSDPIYATYDAGKGEVFVPNYLSDTVSVISDATDTVVATIALGAVAGGFSVTFTERGLPGGSNWSATLNGRSRSSTTSSIAFEVANGTSSFSIGAVSGYSPSPSFGTLLVRGSPLDRSVVYTPNSTTRFPVTASETGLPAGTTWNVTLYGASGTYRANGTGPTITVLAPNGTYLDIVAVNTSSIVDSPSPTGSLAFSELVGNVSVVGAPISIPVRYASVTFAETGLPLGTIWAVIGGTNLTRVVIPGTGFYGIANTARISWFVPFGEYGFAICQNFTAVNAGCSPIPGYSPTPPSGVFTANGTPRTESISFVGNGGGGSGGLPPLLGLPGIEGYIVVGATVTVALLVGLMAALHTYAATGGAAVAGGAGGRRLLRRRRKLPPAAASGPVASAPPPAPPPSAPGPPVPSPSVTYPPAPVPRAGSGAACPGCGRSYKGSERFCTACGRAR